MSLPDNALFNRYAELNIGGRLFSSPPFSIEFDQTLKIGRLTQTKAKLYNPAPDTIERVEPRIEGRTKTFTEVIIDAGYDSDFGTAVLGLIHDYKVIKKSPDIILEMTIGDATEKWINNLVSKSWKKTFASIILNEIINDAGITTDISLGTDKQYRTFSARTLKGAIQKISKDTDSEYYFKNGILKIEPKQPLRTRQVLFISPTSGLLDKIEKTKKGFKFKTLFFYKLQMGDIVQIEDKNTPKSTVRLVTGKKKFSSFGKAECEFEAKEL
jgi:hypothetical protein